MPRVCSVCSHSQRSAIDRALVAGELSNRRIATQYGVTESAIRWHKDRHLPDRLVKAQEAKDEAVAIDVMAELERMFARVNRLFDACDRWLTDADDPTSYDIGPRAEELMVTYEELKERDDGRTYTVRRKAKLSDLLPQVETEDRTVILVETKYADPRELVLKTARQLQGQIELLSRLMGDLKDGPTVNVTINPLWIELRAEIVDALASFPEARQAVADRLSVIEGGKRHAVA